MSYARRVLVNLAKNRWRDMSRRPNEAQDLEGIELPQSPGDDVVVQRDALATLVASLPMAQRKVLVLRYFEDLSVAEVAVILGCGEGTVKSRTNRALSRLRELLAAQETDKAEGQKYAQRY
jgi:RNA polymerase sigma factor (sigma-70 family)